MATLEIKAVNSYPGRISKPVRISGPKSQVQQEASQVNVFLKQLYEMSGKDEHAAADVVFNFMDDQLLAGNFQVCNLAFEKASAEDLLPSGIVSLLMVTRRAKGNLPARARFLEGALRVLAHKEGPAEAEALLGKYR